MMIEERGRAFFHDGGWHVEIAGGAQFFISWWPHPDLYLVRDENRKVVVAVDEDNKRAEFVKFDEEAL